MRSQSPKRAAQNRRYRFARLLFLADHPTCESPWPCGQRATQVHHRMGREGWRLTAVEWFAASCTDCNVVRAEQTDTADAYASNWKVSPDFTGTPDDKPIIPIADLEVAS